MVTPQDDDDAPALLTTRCLHPWQGNTWLGPLHTIDTRRVKPRSWQRFVAAMLVPIDPDRHPLRPLPDLRGLTVPGGPPVTFLLALALTEGEWRQAIDEGPARVLELLASDQPWWWLRS